MKTQRHRPHPRLIRAVAAAVLSAGTLGLPARAAANPPASPIGSAPISAIFATNQDQSQLANINDLVGASSLYPLGAQVFSGSNLVNVYAGLGQGATIAVIDIGLVDNTHQDLTATNTYISNDAGVTSTPPSSLIAWHATAVSGIAAGSGQITISPDGSSFSYYPVGLGMAPLATLWSGTIISRGNPNGTSSDDPNSDPTTTYNVTTASFANPFVTVMQTGINGVKADVVNASFGDPSVTNGYDVDTLIVDSLIASTHIPVVVAAGNSGPGANTVGSPAAGYNKIAVAALGGDPQTDTDLTYNQLASFTSTGPNDFYNPYTGVTIPNVRPVVDIAAPGVNLVAAQSPLVPVVDNQAYFVGSGTSFAAPVVTGVIGQLAAIDKVLAQVYFFLPQNLFTDAEDSRVVKALILNSADKTPGWNNCQTMINGVLTTTQGLDYNVGAGRINAYRAFDNLLNGSFDPKITGTNLATNAVYDRGWDLSTVTDAQPNDYDMGTLSAGATLTTTLTWNVDITYPVDENNLLASESRFEQLYLHVLEDINGTETLIAASEAQYNNVQQLSFTLPDTADYVVEVLWAGELYAAPGGPADHATDYALAWSDAPLPEPVSAAPMGVMVLLLRRRRRGGR